MSDHSRGTEHIDSYLLCATPRTGSSLLCGLLASTCVAGRPEAYFRQPDEHAWADQWGITDAAGEFNYADFVRAAITAGRTNNGVFGAKVMWGTLGEMVAKLGSVHPDLADSELALLGREFGTTRFVFLRRADVVAQAVSWLRAEQTHLWYVGAPGDGGGPPTYDVGGIEHYVQTIREHNAGWWTWFHSVGVEPYVVKYEDLVAGLAGLTRGVLDFLGLRLPSGRVVKPAHRRQADELNLEWAARYRVERAATS